MASNRPFPVDPILTAIAIGYRNPAHALIADRVLPRVEVLQETFKWTEFPIAEAFSYPETQVGRRGQVNTVEFTGTEESASVDDHGLDSDIPYSDIQAAEAARAAGLSKIDPKKLASEGLTNLITLAREVRAAAVVQDANNYAADKKVTLVGNQQFNDDASDPIGVIETGMSATLVYRPNTIAMGRVVWDVVKRHPKIVNAVKGNLTDEGIITKQQFADLFEIDVERLLIGESYVNTNKKGQAVNLQRVWGKSIELLYVDPAKAQANDATITFGFTAQFGQRLAGSWEDRKIGLQGGEWVRVGERVKELVCAKDVGYRIGAAVA
jgi:hypothetical protein